MAVFALTSVTSTLNSVDITAYTKSVTLSLDAAQLDTTDFASGGWTEMIGGLKSGTLSIEFMDDLADDALDEDLYGIFGTVVPFTVKGTSSAISADNPEYQGNVLVNTWSLGGSVGDLAGKSYTLPLSGAVTRDVTA